MKHPVGRNQTCVVQVAATRTLYLKLTHKINSKHFNALNNV